jgi:hypothetical protein
MSKRLKRPSHATVVAYVALFLALSGGAIAIAGGTKINGSKLKKRSVAGKKLKKHTITGTEVNLNKLGKVPTAGTADTAGTANVANSLANLSPLKVTKTTSSASGATYEAARNAATPVTLYDDSHFTIYGKCFIDESGVKPKLDGVAFIASKQNGAVFDGYEDELSGSPPDGYLNPGTEEGLRELLEVGVEPELANIEFDYRASFIATAADGYTINALAGVTVKFGALPEGDGPYGSGNACLFASDALHS